MIDLISYWTSISIFSIYVIWVIIKWGILPSISDSYYHYYKEGNIAKWLPIKMKYLFTFFIFGFSYTALMSDPSPLLFFAITMLGITGASPAFKDKQVKSIGTLHKVGAIGGVLLSQLSIWIEHDMWYITVAFASLSILILILNKLGKLNNKVWWIELLAFVSIFITIGIKIL
jgi:hypothetical protein